MAKIYYEKDATMALLKDKVIGIIGHGNQGHAFMSYPVNDTAEYGDVKRYLMVINESVREEMAGILEDIQNGREAEHQIEVVGKKLRSMMPLLK